MASDRLPTQTFWQYELGHSSGLTSRVILRRSCQEHDISPKVEVLFIDTSHLYEHTLAEIDAWFPHLAERAVVFFHDTNLRRFFRRRDHTIGRGWNNSRGVIRALETRFGAGFDERRPFRGELESWQVIHDPVCNGLTILTRSAGRGNAGSAT